MFELIAVRNLLRSTYAFLSESSSDSLRSNAHAATVLRLFGEIVAKNTANSCPRTCPQPTWTPDLRLALKSRMA
jgi:hypothetical protein